MANEIKENLTTVYPNPETGRLTDFMLFYLPVSSEEMAVVGNNGYLTSIEIPSAVEWNGTRYAVTRIEDEAFSKCSRLKSIFVPISIKSYGNNAFKGCNAEITEEVVLEKGNILSDAILL